MGDAASHLPRADNADLMDGVAVGIAPRRGVRAERRARNYVVHGHSSTSTLRVPRLLELGIEFRQDGKKIAYEAVVGDLEDRRVGILVNGDDHLGSFMPARCWIAPEMPTAM